MKSWLKWGKENMVGLIESPGWWLEVLITVSVNIFGSKVSAGY